MRRHRPYPVVADRSHGAHPDADAPHRSDPLSEAHREGERRSYRVVEGHIAGGKDSDHTDRTVEDGHRTTEDSTEHGENRHGVDNRGKCRAPAYPDGVACAVAYDGEHAVVAVPLDDAERLHSGEESEPPECAMVEGALERPTLPLLLLQDGLLEPWPRMLRPVVVERRHHELLVALSVLAKDVVHLLAVGSPVPCDGW